jgi:signal transduction histidine kinase
MRIALSKSSSLTLAFVFTIILLFSVMTLLYMMERLMVFSPEDPWVYPLGWLTILWLVLVAGGGFFIGDRVVYRINLIADTAEQIMHTGDLSRRIPVPNTWDDLSKLATILNQLFERIETLMDTVRQVSDHAAHDLRTPLTRLRNQLEMLHDRGDDEQLGITVQTEKLLQEADQILATFAALLRIGNIESGRWRVESEVIALDTLIADVIEFYEPLASEQQQQIIVSLAQTPFQGDKHLLFQAVANLLDNAIKYAPAQAEIHVALHKENDHIRFSIMNTGSYVPPEHAKKLFQRYYRADAARSDKAGNGLGLSLVKAIIELHKGSVSARNVADGFEIVCILPVF